MKNSDQSRKRIIRVDFEIRRYKDSLEKGEILNKAEIRELKMKVHSKDDKIERQEKEIR